MDKPFGFEGQRKTFGRRLKNVFVENNPGPGQYNPRSSYTERNKSHPLITKSLRERPDRELKPDAGMYQRLD